MSDTEKLPNIKVRIPVKHKRQFIRHTVNINQARVIIEELTKQIKEHETEGLLSRMMNTFTSTWKGNK